MKNDYLAEAIGEVIDGLKKETIDKNKKVLELKNTLEYYAAIKGPLGEPARQALKLITQ